MSQRTLEERVTALEEAVARLTGSVPGVGPPVQEDWRSTIGMFANDPIMKEIDEEGRKIREEDRRRAGA